MRGVLLAFVSIGVLSGCAIEPRPRVIVHQYSYQAVPPSVPGGIPTQPPGPPQPVPHQTIWPPRPFGDPTVVIFQNWSDRATLFISIDGQPPINLPPGTVSANNNLGEGEHTVKWWGEVPTTHPAHPVLKSAEKITVIRVRAEERTKIVPLTE